MDTNALRRAAENRKLATYAAAEEQYASDLAAIDRVREMLGTVSSKETPRTVRRQKRTHSGQLWPWLREYIVRQDGEFTAQDVFGALDANSEYTKVQVGVALSALRERGEIIVARTVQTAGNRRPMNVYRRPIPATAEQSRPSTNGEHAPEPELATA